MSVVYFPWDQVIGGGHPQQQQQHLTSGTSRSKAEEIRMKEQQLHAAQLAEERILRVAQKRQVSFICFSFSSFHSAISGTLKRSSC